MPLVSVVIPSYNHEKFLDAAVKSVLGQTEADLELIVVDDGSKDGSLQILSAITDTRLKIYQQENKGAHAAINRGLNLATGQYLTLLNSDDIYHPQRLEKLLAVQRNHPAAGLCGSYLQVINSSGDSLGIKHGYHDLEPWPVPNHHRSFRSGEDLRLVLLTENYWSTTSNYFFSRPIFDRTGPFLPLRYVHDWDFALRVAQHAPLLMVPEPLLSYRVHAANTIRENQAAMLFEICWIFAVHLPQAANTPWFQAREPAYRYSQLLNSLPLNGCERILSLLLLQNISQDSDLALSLLNPQNPTRISYLEYINNQIGEPTFAGAAANTNPRRLNFTQSLMKLLRGGKK